MLTRLIPLLLVFVLLLRGQDCALSGTYLTDKCKSSVISNRTAAAKILGRSIESDENSILNVELRVS
jgi:hypothetical protein